jgi:hypothetical protein
MQFLGQSVCPQETGDLQANGMRQWIDLKILKESNPVQVAEYVTARNIADKPAFAWWVSYVLRK